MGHAKLVDGVDRAGGKVEGVAVHTGKLIGYRPSD
jgi:hypothetical protein